MDEQTLLALNIDELYRIFIAKTKDMLEEEIGNKPILTQKEINQVKYGINIRFSFNKYFHYKDSNEYGLFRIKPKSNTINVDGKGHEDYDLFQEELENRMSIMLNALLKYYEQDKDLIKPDLGRLNQ